MSVDAILDDETSDAEHIANVREDLVTVIDELEAAREVLVHAEDADAHGAGVDHRRQALEEADDVLEDAEAAFEDSAAEFTRVLQYYSSGDEQCPSCEANLVTVRGLTQNEHVCRECGLVESERVDPTESSEQTARLWCLVVATLAGVATAFGGVVVDAQVAGWLLFAGLIGFLAFSVGVDELEARARRAVAEVTG